jgi:parvulin-like peptidyl-prolyl isomerase
MAQSSSFLTTPLWQAVKRTYTALIQATWKKAWGYQSFRRALLIALVAIVAYVVLISGSALAIYKYKTNNTFTRFTEKLFPYPAALVGGSSIPLNRYRTEVSTRTHYASTHNLSTTPAETSQFVIGQLIDRQLYQQALVNNAIKLDEQSLDDKLQEIYDQVGGKEKLSQFLDQQYGPSASLDLFQTWMREAATESAVQNQLLKRATVRHILVAVPENSTEDQVSAAKAKAQEIRASITDVSQFGEIARNRSEDVASRDKGGEFGTTNHGDTAPVLSKDFEDAIFNLPLGQISDPIRTPFGWHIVVVDKREGTIDLSKKAYTEQLRERGNVHIFIGS